MDELKSRLEEKYGSFDPYGGYKMFISFVVTCIPGKYRKDEIEFNLELFKKSFLGCEEGELSSEEVLDKVFNKKKGGEVKEAVTIRCGDYTSVFWRFYDLNGILKKNINDITRYSSRYLEWISFLLTKYGVWDSTYSISEVVEYSYLNDEILKENKSIEEVLEIMRTTSRGRYDSIREYMEENLYRIKPKKILNALGDVDFYDMFEDWFGDKEDWIDGDEDSILIFKK